MSFFLRLETGYAYDCVCPKSAVIFESGFEGGGVMSDMQYTTAPFLDNNDKGRILRFFLTQIADSPAKYALYTQLMGYGVNVAAYPGFGCLVFDCRSAASTFTFHISDAINQRIAFGTTVPNEPVEYLVRMFNSVLNLWVMYKQPFMPAEMSFDSTLGTGPLMPGQRYYIKTQGEKRLTGMIDPGVPANVLFQSEATDTTAQWTVVASAHGTPDPMAYNIENVEHGYILCITNAGYPEFRYTPGAWERLLVVPDPNFPGRFGIQADPNHNLGYRLRSAGATDVWTGDFFDPVSPIFAFEFVPVGFGY